MELYMVPFCAGVLEGEGSFLTATGGFTPVVTCQMTDKDILERLKTTFSTGNITPITKRQAHWKDAWTWKITGDDAIRVMDMIYPYMSERRKVKIDEVRKVWYDRKQIVEGRRARALSAAREYLQMQDAGTPLSLRKLSEKYDVGHETIRQAIWQID